MSIQLFDKTINEDAAVKRYLEGDYLLKCTAGTFKYSADDGANWFYIDTSVKFVHLRKARLCIQDYDTGSPNLVVYALAPNARIYA